MSEVDAATNITLVTILLDMLIDRESLDDLLVVEAVDQVQRADLLSVVREHCKRPIHAERADLVVRPDVLKNVVLLLVNFVIDISEQVFTGLPLFLSCLILHVVNRGPVKFKTQNVHLRFDHVVHLL